MALKVNALVPSERTKECTQHHMAWSGRMPCTGVLRCTMCGTRADECRCCGEYMEGSDHCPACGCEEYEERPDCPDRKESDNA